MESKRPKPKKRHRKLGSLLPLPIVQVSDNEIYKFTGHFDGFSVTVKDGDEIRKLNGMGCFGKPNLSRYINERTLVLRKRVFDRRNKLKLETTEQAAEKVIVVSDSDSENEDYFVDLKAEYRIDLSGSKETLNLCLEEAFFLFHFVKCLNIIHSARQLNEQEVWESFCKSDRYFVQNYPVYHHFRVKNWVVKPGIKFGGDYLLYKEGPSFYHSSQLIIIEVLDSSTLERRNDLGRRFMEIVDVLGLNRLCETVGKELLICQLLWPSNLTTIQPRDLPQLSINETVLKRWISSRKRDQEETQLQ